MKPGPYVVWKRDRYGTVFLRLDGPFQYPAWTTDLARAQRLTGPRAVQWASLEGGEHLHLATQTIPSEPSGYEPPGVKVQEGPQRLDYEGDPTIHMGGAAFGVVGYDPEDDD